MSFRDHPRKIPVDRIFKLRQPSLRRNTRIKPSRFLKSVEVVKRCSSDPTLENNNYHTRYEDHRSLTVQSELGIHRRQTCANIFSPFDNLSPPKFEGYNRDAKVVVNVTVEGSPGPVRAMLKLGSTVEETIRLVVNKYGEEGRSPYLHKYAAAAASSFELHSSHFSLQSLNKSDMIGETGSRSFYLRKRDSKIIQESASSSDINVCITNNIHHSPNLLLNSLLASISRMIDNFMRRIKKLWKIMRCMPSSRS